MPRTDPRPTPIRPATAPVRRLADLAVRLAVAPPDHDAAVTGVTHDSTAVQPGDLYAALPGTHTHGARFSDDAVAAGAVAVLTDVHGGELAASSSVPVLVVDDPRLRLGDTASWIYGEPSRRMRMLGVTGTNGKTTTTYLLDAGLRAAGKLTGLVGTIETRIGEHVVPSARTTPEAPDLQATLAVMAERGVASVSMEVSSHALALHRVDGTVFDVVAFTNLSQDHLDFHADLDSYFDAKARLFTTEFSPAGVVNVDDEYGRRLLERATVAVTTVSTTSPDADWWASGITSSSDGTRFLVHGPDVEQPVAVRLTGAFNAANALLAFVTLVTAGVDAEHASTGIGDLSVVPGRAAPKPGPAVRAVSGRSGS